MSFDASLSQYIPHGFCLSWNPRLLALHIMSDGIIALSYASIPAMLLKLVRERHDLQYSWAFVLFGAFILACGATHVMSLWTLWQPDYLLAGLIKALAAAVSVGTAMVLWPLIPRAIALPGPAQWQAVHADLRRQVREREQAEQEVRRLNAELEHRVRERTAALEQANQNLSALHAELEQRVEDRTRELREAQAALLTSARRAGMAEIATNVLHNVGNVLNSLNVAVGVASRHLRQSRLPGLDKSVSLLDEHAAELPRFLSDDPRGRLLPDYLRRLDDSLRREHDEMHTELAHMAQLIDHIKHIVAIQQSHAGSQQVVALTSVQAMVDDALRMNAGLQAGHHTVVEQDIAPLPELPLDRHRTLQVLVNLISNAQQAMAAPGATGHRLRIRAWRNDVNSLCLSVEDQGDGIAPDNLSRIFAHGFTTRKHGHGFGLHGCALAAKDMGGELRVHSDGPGRGATFTLVLPIAHQEDP